jgi:hypothetical protein
MLPPKLVDYLREKKKAGYPDAMIRDEFIKKGWSAAILDEVYALLNNTNIPSPPIVTVPVVTAPQTTINQERETEISSEPTIPKKWLIVLASLFFTLSSMYGQTAAIAMSLAVIMQQTMMNLGGTESVLSSYPGLYGALIVSIGTSLYFLYLTFKSSNVSAKSWNLKVLSLIVAPLIFYPLCNLFMYPILKQAAVLGNTQPELLLPGTDLLITGALLFALWRTKQFHTQADTNLATKYRILFGIAIAISILTLAIAGVTFSRTTTTSDMGYQVVSEQVDFPLHTLTTLPSNLAYGGKYEMKLDDKGVTTVRLPLTTPIAQVTAETNTTIVIEQQKAPATFDLISDLATYEPQPEPVMVPIAADGAAYLARKPLGTSYLYNLEFVSTDGVLVRILSPDADPETLIQVAQAMQ